MGKQNASRTGLFLIELILSIFFFIIAAAVVLQLFVQSHFISKNTISINNALLYSQNMSEVFLSDVGSLDESFDDVKAMYNGQLITVSSMPDNVILLLFDNNWESTKDLDTAKYSVVADYTNDDTFSYLNVYVNEYNQNLITYLTSGDYKSSLVDNDYIYHQEVKKYNGK
jgi:Tfp pilus assembly protein PilV